MKNGNLLDFGPKSFISYILCDIYLKYVLFFDQYKDYLRNDINEISYSTAISFASQIAKVIYKLLVQRSSLVNRTTPNC